MKKIVIGILGLMMLGSCREDGYEPVYEVKLPAKIISVSHFKREDVGFNGTKYLAYEKTEVLLVDQTKDMVKVVISGDAQDLVKGQIITSYMTLEGVEIK